MSNDKEDKDKNNIVKLFKELNTPYSSTDAPSRKIGGQEEKGERGRGRGQRSDMYEVLSGIIAAVHDVRKEVLELRAALLMFLRELKKEREGEKKE